jgi:hypothetical protein
MRYSYELQKLWGKWLRTQFGIGNHLALIACSSLRVLHCVFFTSVMNEIFIWAPENMRKMATDTIWNWQSSRTNCVLRILREVEWCKLRISWGRQLAKKNPKSSSCTITCPLESRAHSNLLLNQKKIDRRTAIDTRLKSLSLILRPQVHESKKMGGENCSNIQPMQTPVHEFKLLQRISPLQWARKCTQKPQIHHHVPSHVPCNLVRIPIIILNHKYLHGRPWHTTRLESHNGENN